jgi:hypothetical protein
MSPIRYAIHPEEETLMSRRSGPKVEQLLRDLNNANGGCDLGEGEGGPLFDSESKSPINPLNNTFGV